MRWGIGIGSGFPRIIRAIRYPHYPPPPPSPHYENVENSLRNLLISLFLKIAVSAICQYFQGASELVEFSQNSLHFRSVLLFLRVVSQFLHRHHHLLLLLLLPCLHRKHPFLPCPCVRRHLLLAGSHPSLPFSSPFPPLLPFLFFSLLF